MQGRPVSDPAVHLDRRVTRGARPLSTLSPDPGASRELARFKLTYRETLQATPHLCPRFYPPSPIFRTIQRG